MGDRFSVLSREDIQAGVAYGKIPSASMYLKAPLEIANFLARAGYLNGKVIILDDGQLYTGDFPQYLWKPCSMLTC